MTERRESQKVKDARDNRATTVAADICEWKRLADMNQYPRSLHDIVLAALTHEYRLGQRRTGA